MNIAADFVNELGRTCQRRAWLRGARVAYSCATLLAPAWPDPWFNRGLIAKFERRWRDSLRFNRRAADLDPHNRPVWWNIGIAATAVGDWTAAREARSR